MRLVAACAAALGPFVLKHTALFAGKRPEPASHNTDGDELVFVTDRFDLDPAARAEIEARLAAMPGAIAADLEGWLGREHLDLT